MDLKHAFGLALRGFRKSRNLTQEDFSGVSSRTYLSTLERGLKVVSLEKVDELASVLGVHPLTLLMSTYLMLDSNQTPHELAARIQNELSESALKTKTRPTQ